LSAAFQHFCLNRIALGSPEIHPQCKAGITGVELMRRLICCARGGVVEESVPTEFLSELREAA
jgi:hypothetical protein